MLLAQDFIFKVLKGTAVAQLVEHLTLDLMVMNLSPKLDIEITLKKKKKERKSRILTSFQLASAVVNLYHEE